MNVLKMVDGVSGLFPRKVKVQLCNFKTGEIIGTYKMNSELIPDSFSKPTQIDVDGRLWRIMKAEIVREDTYLKGKLIHFYVQEPRSKESVASHDVPTYARPMPLSSIEARFNSFSITILLEEWRQIEFLPIARMPVIQDTIAGIKSVFKTDDEGFHLRGYESVFLRESLKGSNLQIPFEVFCSEVNVLEKGSVILGNAFVENAFGIKTNDHIYYGILHDNVITDFALQEFDFMDSEIASLMERFDLVLASWCEPAILVPGNDDDTKADPYISAGEII